MRPKRVILCINPNESELSVTRFTLETHGYRVLGANSSQEGIALLKTPGEINLVLCSDSKFVPHAKSWADLIAKLKGIKPYVPIILLGDPSAPTAGETMADAFLSKKDCPQAELIERIKVMSYRKRGPRKGSESAMRCAWNKKDTVQEAA